MYVFTLHCARYIESFIFYKIEGGDRFTADPTKHSIFYANNFLYISQKKSEPNFQWQHALVIFCLTHFPLR